MGFRGDVEGLRAIAVLAVLGYHFDVPGFGGGFVGVDVFFVVSGFLITSLLVIERDRTGRIDLVAFLTRRIRRLLPLATLVLVTTAVAARLWLPATRFDELGLDLVASGVFVANLVFAARGGDYLAADLAASPVQHFWSLAVEEQFYLVWPTALVVVGLGARRWRRRGVGLAAVIALASFITGVGLSARSPSWAYYATVSRAWELALGALLALIGRDLRRRRRQGAVLTGIGMTGIVVAVITFGQVDTFPGAWALLPVLATAAVLAGGDPRGIAPSRLLATRPLGWIGARSYGLYLWHWPILVIAEEILARSLGLVATVVALGLTVVVNEVSFRFVETPMRTAAVLVDRRGPTLALGGCLIVVAVGAGGLLGQIRPGLDTGVIAAPPDSLASVTTILAPARDLVEADRGSDGDLVSRPVEAVSEQPLSLPTPRPVAPGGAPRPLEVIGEFAPEAITAALGITAVPENLRPGLYEARTDTGRLYGDGCHLYFAASLTETCVYGDPQGSVTVALWGDSHAAQWFPALEEIAIERSWRLVALTQGGCPVIEVAVWNRSADAVASHCGAWRDAVRERLVAAEVDVVVVAQYWGLLEASSRRPIPSAVWRRELPGLLDGLLGDGITPVVLLDTPDPPGDVPECLLDHRRDPQRCAPGARGLTEGEVADAMATSALDAGVGVIDPRSWLCSPEGCPVIVGDLLLYRDSHHLSAQGAAWLAPLLAGTLGDYVSSLTASTAAR